MMTDGGGAAKIEGQRGCPPGPPARAAAAAAAASVFGCWGKSACFVVLACETVGRIGRLEDYKNNLRRTQERQLSPQSSATTKAPWIGRKGSPEEGESTTPLCPGLELPLQPRKTKAGVALLLSGMGHHMNVGRSNQCAPAGPLCGPNAPDAPNRLLALALQCKQRHARGLSSSSSNSLTEAQARALNHPHHLAATARDRNHGSAIGTPEISAGVPGPPSIDGSHASNPLFNPTNATGTPRGPGVGVS